MRAATPAMTAEAVAKALGGRKASGDCSAGSGSVCVPLGDRVACRPIAELAVNDLKRTDDPLVVRSALGIIAITKGLRAYARVLLELDESEVEAIVDGEIGGA